MSTKDSRTPYQAGKTAANSQPGAIFGTSAPGTGHRFAIAYVCARSHGGGDHRGHQ